MYEVVVIKGPTSPIVHPVDFSGIVIQRLIMADILVQTIGCKKYDFSSERGRNEAVIQRWDYDTVSKN